MVREQTLSDNQKLLDSFLEEINEIRRALGDLEAQKGDKKDLIEAKQKILVALDEKADVSEIKTALTSA